ncbi:heavy-metal-associated domain-containing protein [Jatrophihabitans sp.]|uniref:heavy-metal-associated domain-containing protein n=1 Tax=Jatrophihabitans sp. TaxID=1932789 RepID=UPI0030C669F4|nr:putative heavy-metal detoxification protein [Jatrophihabitans sp.]
MTETSYTVAGMTCGHCVSAVQAEVGALDGVESAVVELDSGRLVVSGTDVPADAVRAAVAEAGYSLV